VKGFFSKIFGLGQDKVLPPPPNGAQAQGQAANDPTQDPKKKKGLFGKFVGIFKEDKPSNPPANPPANSGDAPH
jgi:hypothetical protein